MKNLKINTFAAIAVYAMLAFVIFYGCKDAPIKHEKSVNRQDLVGTIYLNPQQNVPIFTYVIDSCEYIGLITNFHNQFLTHKGNCVFCAERVKNDSLIVYRK